MHITHTDIFRFSIRMEPFVIATGTMHFAQNVFIRIYTSAGGYGVGECSAFPMIVGETQDTCLVMAREFAKMIKGKNPLDISARLNDLDSVAAHNPTIKSAFDMAFYDLAAKQAQQPLYAFLGGEKRAIETDMTIGIGTPEQMAESAVKHEQAGATVLKIKLGKSIANDLDRLRTIRQAVDPAMKIRVDANQGWSFEDALHALRAMEPLNIQFCEQPMRTWYDDLLPELCAQSPIPLMADESCYNHHDARKLIKAGACHSVNIKFAKSGGIAEASRIHDEASKANIPCMIGSMLESRLALTANVHFAYASPNVQYFDLDTCLLGQLEDPITGGVVYNGFFLYLADAIGIGADVEEHFLEKCESWRV